MARIAGITTQKNTKGEITHVTINVKKHQEVMPMLNKPGIVEKTKFQIECEEGISLDELDNRLTKHIENLPWEK